MHWPKAGPETKDPPQIHTASAIKDETRVTMDPEALVTFLFNAPPDVRMVELLGSWDNFSKTYPMHHDRRRGKGTWTGCFQFANIIFDGQTLDYTSPRNGCLKQGGRYWYYFRLNDDVEAYDDCRAATADCPLLPGQTVNVLEVPREEVDTTPSLCRSLGDVNTCYFTSCGSGGAEVGGRFQILQPSAAAVPETFDEAAAAAAAAATGLPSDDQVPIHDVMTMHQSDANYGSWKPNTRSYVPDLPTNGRLQGSRSAHTPPPSSLRSSSQAHPHAFSWPSSDSPKRAISRSGSQLAKWVSRSISRSSSSKHSKRRRASSSSSSSLHDKDRLEQLAQIRAILHGQTPPKTPNGRTDSPRTPNRRTDSPRQLNSRQKLASLARRASLGRRLEREASNEQLDGATVSPRPRSSRQKLESLARRASVLLRSDDVEAASSSDIPASVTVFPRSPGPRQRLGDLARRASVLLGSDDVEAAAASSEISARNRSLGPRQRLGDLARRASVLLGSDDIEAAAAASSEIPASTRSPGTRQRLGDLARRASVLLGSDDQEASPEIPHGEIGSPRPTSSRQRFDSLAKRASLILKFHDTEASPEAENSANEISRPFSPKNGIESLARRISTRVRSSQEPCSDGEIESPRPRTPGQQISSLARRASLLHFGDRSEGHPQALNGVAASTQPVTPRQRPSSLARRASIQVTSNLRRSTGSPQPRSAPHGRRESLTRSTSLFGRAYEVQTSPNSETAYTAPHTPLRRIGSLAKRASLLITSDDWRASTSADGSPRPASSRQRLGSLARRASLMRTSPPRRQSQTHVYADYDDSNTQHTPPTVHHPLDIPLPSSHQVSRLHSRVVPSSRFRPTTTAAARATSDDPFVSTSGPQSIHDVQFYSSQRSSLDSSAPPADPPRLYALGDLVQQSLADDIDDHNANSDGNNDREVMAMGSESSPAVGPIVVASRGGTLHFRLPSSGGGRTTADVVKLLDERRQSAMMKPAGGIDEKSSAVVKVEPWSMSHPEPQTYDHQQVLAESEARGQEEEEESIPTASSSFYSSTATSSPTEERSELDFSPAYTDVSSPGVHADINNNNNNNANANNSNGLYTPLRLSAGYSRATTAADFEDLVHPDMEEADTSASIHPGFGTDKAADLTRQLDGLHFQQSDFADFLPALRYREASECTVTDAAAATDDYGNESALRGRQDSADLMKPLPPRPQHMLPRKALPGRPDEGIVESNLDALISEMQYLRGSIE